MAKRYDSLKTLGADVVVVGPGSAADAARLARNLSTPFPVLADSDRAALLAFGFERRLWGILQQNGTVLVNRSGKAEVLAKTNNPGASLNINDLETALRAG